MSPKLMQSAYSHFAWLELMSQEFEICCDYENNANIRWMDWIKDSLLPTAEDYWKQMFGR